MSTYGKCEKCGSALKLLFTSFYCPTCDKSDLKSKTPIYAYTPVPAGCDRDWQGSIPIGIHVEFFSRKEDAINEGRLAKGASGLDFSVLQVNISNINSVNFSTPYNPVFHLTSRALPYSVVE